jgi:hypothetical protein
VVRIGAQGDSPPAGGREPETRLLRQPEMPDRSEAVAAGERPDMAAGQRPDVAAGERTDLSGREARAADAGDTQDLAPEQDPDLAPAEDPDVAPREDPDLAPGDQGGVPAEVPAEPADAAAADTGPAAGPDTIAAQDPAASAPPADLALAPAPAAAVQDRPTGPVRNYSEMAGAYARPVPQGKQGARTRLAGGKRAWIAVAAALVVVAAAGLVTVLNLPSAAGKTGASATHRPARSPSPRATAPLRLLSVTPATGATGVNGAAPIRLHFNTDLGPSSPMPVLSPAIKGTWLRTSASTTFRPDRGFRPGTRVTVRIPGGSSGLQSAGGGLLTAAVTVHFRTGHLSPVRMEQLLALLGYLPLSWGPLPGSQPGALTDGNAQLSAAYAPPAGSYTWASGYPVQLHRLWRRDLPSLVLDGAVMAFEADHNLALDGVIGPGMWHAMFRALILGQRNLHGYSYALARQRLPQTLTVWHDGTVIFRHLANTGIGVAPTAVGTSPVYIRLQTQIMRGRNPDGSKYADPVAWVAYFRGGEAIHYFPRYSYGSPQSLGCVELPWAPAKRIWPYLTYGTLVTVTAP